MCVYLLAILSERLVHIYIVDAAAIRGERVVPSWHLVLRVIPILSGQ